MAAAPLGQQCMSIPELNAEVPAHVQQNSPFNVEEQPELITGKVLLPSDKAAGREHGPLLHATRKARRSSLVTGNSVTRAVDEERKLFPPELAARCRIFLPVAQACCLLCRVFTDTPTQGWR